MYIPLYTLFVDQTKDIDTSSALYSLDGPFQVSHSDIVDLRFVAKSAVDPKYCLLKVDLFNSKIYTYPMKEINILKKKLELFYEKIKNKRNNYAKIPLRI